MQNILDWISTPFVLWACTVLLLLLIILPLYLRMAKQREEARKNNERMQQLLQSNVAERAAERAAEREELNGNLRGMSESVVRLMGEMSRSQQQQLDSFGGQIRAMSRTDEERMDRMRSNIEDKLTAYDTQMVRVSQTLEDKLSLNERRLSEMRQTLGDGMARMQGENEKKLEQIRETVDEKLNSTLDKRLGESFRTVSERLEQVYKGLGEMQTLAVGVGDLKKVLTSVKTRGIWGEVQLGALLEQVLAPGQYETNVAVKPGSTERVEYAIRLPGKEVHGQPVYLPIDAKFPAEDYQRLLDAVDAGDKQAAEAAANALALTIRTEAKRIRAKYVDPPHTTDFAIMFLPVEGLFAEVLRHNGIVEQLQNDFRIVITGPTTLLALLNSLQMGFRTMAIEQRSSEVWELLGAVKTEFGRFADLLTKTQQRLRQATDSIEVAARKTRTIQRKLQNVQELSERDAQRLIREGEPEALPAAEPGLEEGWDD
ncbi:MAG: DNA recombination protein RmuC [Oscillospiraceae bacterium]|jgi:DNA recombination protein RmuC|nr:DNA recombination protein RmuC [Oscillospiraceae bacterium]